MGKERIIEKAKGMEKKGAIKLLKYHQSLQELKISRLKGEIGAAQKVHDAIYNAIGEREKEGGEPEDA